MKERKNEGKKERRKGKERKKDRRPGWSCCYFREKVCHCHEANIQESLRVKRFLALFQLLSDPEKVKLLNQ